MKHLRKLFESEEKEEILEYLQICFVDYIDQDYNFVYYDGTNTGLHSSYTMEINLGEAKGFSKIAEIGRKITKISEDFVVNMKRVNIEYPNFTHDFVIDTNSYEELVISIEITVKK